MRSYDYRDLPKWRKFLIDAKWAFIKTNRKAKGMLPLAILFTIILIVGFIQQQQVIDALKPQYAKPICTSICDFNV